MKLSAKEIVRIHASANNEFTNVPQHHQINRINSLIIQGSKISLVKRYDICNFYRQMS